MSQAGFPASLYAGVWTCVLCIAEPVAIVLYLIVIGTPKNAKRISDDLQRAGVVNDVDEPPILIERKLDLHNPTIEILVFQTVGIPFDIWAEKQLAIESALNAFVVKVQEGRARNQVMLSIVCSEGAFPQIAFWNEQYNSDNDDVLILGVTAAGTQVTADLSQIPHMLIGGSSGSGKSVLMGLLLHQALTKGMELYIADFKGGLDYNGSPWKGECEINTTIDSVTYTLDSIVIELNRRKQLLYDAECKNINEYNDKCEGSLHRIVFGCDELAELTDKAGITDKEHKAKIDHVIGQLSTIARQGRALGIHLILATQRPDANVLPGQIKNNIDFRACGRADNTLAMIILDNADAAEKLPKDGHRFMLHDGTIFLPYFWSDK